MLTISVKLCQVMRMSDEESIFKDAGKELIDYSQNYGVDELRSRSELLFPAIYIASQRMSGRAISRWLEDKQGIKFSPAAVANALRDQEKYFKAIAERVQPMAEHVALSYGFEVDDYLYKRKNLADAHEELELNRQERVKMGLPEIDEYIESMAERIDDEWFSLDRQIRFRCICYFDFEGQKNEENEGDNGDESK